MEQQVLKTSLAKIGADVVFEGSRRGFDIDVQNSKFIFRVQDESVFSELHVLNIDKESKHLLLMRKVPVVNKSGTVINFNKIRFLLGHDERDWFVAGIPDRTPVSTVQQAKDALRPSIANDSLRRKAKRKDRNRRRNKGFIRQGEWFCVPVDIDLSDKPILRNEPLVRGRGKPHIVSEVVRIGGTEVYVHPKYPQGVSQVEHTRIIRSAANSGLRIGWTHMVRDPKVYGRGYMRHPDHKTIKLPGWHRIVPNTEHEADFMRNISFLD